MADKPNPRMLIQYHPHANSMALLVTIDYEFGLRLAQDNKAKPVKRKPRKKGSPS
jgi:hypothetical protein